VRTKEEIQEQAKKIVELQFRVDDPDNIGLASLIGWLSALAWVCSGEEPYTPLQAEEAAAAPAVGEPTDAALNETLRKYGLCPVHRDPWQYDANRHRVWHPLGAGQHVEYLSKVQTQRTNGA
jgi:hypothetical protein